MKKKVIIIGTLFLFFAFAFFTFLSSTSKAPSSDESAIFAGNKRQMAQSGVKFCCKNNQTTSCGAIACTEME